MAGAHCETGKDHGLVACGSFPAPFVGPWSRKRPGILNPVRPGNQPAGERKGETPDPL